jgi:hypothetical protein
METANVIKQYDKIHNSENAEVNWCFKIYGRNVAYSTRIQLPFSRYVQVWGHN